MRKILLAIFAVLFSWPALAQQDYGNVTGYSITTCGSPPVGFTSSSATMAYPGPLTIDANGFLCIHGSVTLTSPLPNGGNTIGNVGQSGSPWGVTESTTFATAVSSAVTRVANTTQYTANTGWCTLTSSCVTTFSWANVCRANGGTILIPNISVYSSANQSTPLQGILWLFNTVPGTIISDDVTFNIASADFANLVGGSFNGIPFTLASSQASGASNAGISLTGLNYEATCASGSTTLYGMVQVVNTYTPVSAEVLTIRLHSIGLN